jgi:hypothetical protein
MTPNETTAILRKFARAYRANAHIWGASLPGVPAEVGAAIESAIETIEHVENMKAALRQHHKNAMGEGLDPSRPLTKLRVSAYQQTNLYANTIAALEEPK